MKKLSFLFIPLLLCSCTLQKTYHYVDAIDRYISYYDVFYQKHNQYYIYIYSSFCGHCRELESDIVYYAINHDNFFLLEYTNKIKTGSNYYESIGVHEMEQVIIPGTPTILNIKEKTLIDILVGENNIKNFISN